jgi:hypothetical protein
MKNTENTEEDPDDTQPASEGDSHMQYSSGYFYSQSIGATTKMTCKKLGYCRYHLIILNLFGPISVGSMEFCCILICIM